MGTPFRDRDVEDLKRGSAANLAGTLARALKPISLAVIANLYGGEVFGQFAFCYATVDLLVGFSVFGTDHGLWNFVSQHREAGRPQLEAQALRTGLLWTVGVATLLTLGTVLLADPLATYALNAPELADPLRIIAPAILAFAVARVLLAATRGLRIMRYHVLVLDFGEMALIFVLAPAFYLAGLRDWGVFWALLATGLGVLLAASVCFLRHFSLRAILRDRGAPLVSREMLSYDLALGWALVAGLLTRRLDILLIAHFQPMAVVGAYTLASEFGGALGKVRSSFSPVVIPVLAARAARARESLREPSAFMALSVTALSLPILHVFVVAGPLILALYRPEFVAAYPALLLIAAAHGLHGLMGPPGEALSVAGMPRYVATFASLQVVLVATLGWLLIPQLGMLGAAVASGGALVLSRLPLLLIARRELRYSSLSIALSSLLARAVATIGIGGVAAVLLRGRWPLAGYAVGLLALFAYVWWSWETLATALRQHRTTGGSDREPRKFLVFTSEYPPLRTGVATYNRVLAEGLAQRGHDVTVLTFRSPGAGSGETLAKEICVPVGVAKWLEPVRILLGLAAYRLLAPNYDATLLSSDLAQRIAGDLRLAGTTPFVCTVHGSEVTKRYPARSWIGRADWQLRLKTLQSAARVIAISRYTRDLLTAAGLPQHRIQIIHNGLPGVWFEADADSAAVTLLKRRLGIRPDEVVMLTLARVVERKGHDRVLQALPKVLQRHPSVRYVIAGTGENVNRIRALANELLPSDRVIFTGEVSEGEKKTYYDACDIFVMPSLHDGRRVEGLGISFIEAAARRKPSIGGNHGGVPEVIDDGNTGYLVDPDDIETLAKRLSNLIDNGALRRQFGDTAYSRASERFRDAMMVKQIEQVLRAAVSQRAEATRRNGSQGKPISLSWR